MFRMLFVSPLANPVPLPNYFTNPLPFTLLTAVTLPGCPRVVLQDGDSNLLAGLELPSGSLHYILHVIAGLTWKLPGLS